MLAHVDYNKLGERIQQYRRKARKTQAELAEIVGVSTQFIGNLERGRAVPSLDTLISLCFALRVSSNDLLLDSLPIAGFVPWEPVKLRQPTPVYNDDVDCPLLSEQAESIYDDMHLLVGYLLPDQKARRTPRQRKSPT